MAEVDESNGEEKSEPVSEMEASVKGQNLGCILSPVFSDILAINSILVLT